MGEWFKEMQIVEKLGYVEIGDDIAHAIVHIGNVPLTMHDGKMKYFLADVLHVSTKTLVSIGQMVEQGLQVKFTHVGLFFEEFKEDGHLIAQGQKVDKIFTLDVDVLEIKVAMFAYGTGVIADIKIWHKRIGHVNVQRLKSMQN